MLIGALVPVNRVLIYLFEKSCQNQNKLEITEYIFSRVRKEDRNVM